MKRRQFLQRVSPFIALPLVMGGSSVRALVRPFVPDIYTQLAQSDRVLVIVQMGGGNDGINTVLARDQYSAYMNLRSNIAIPEQSVLPLTDATGLHPAMTGLKELYDDGKLAVIQGVSYPSPNFSHFRATDIWNSASNSNEVLHDGWLGRFLEGEYDGYPAGYPNTSMPDPLAIQIGSVVSFALQGSEHGMALAIQNPNTFYSMVNGTDTSNFDTPPDTRFGELLAYTRQVQLESEAYAGRIKTASDRAPNRYTYPASNSLASQLQTVARLIAGGLQTRIYVVSIGGFDTHADQVVASDHTIGTHATLLKRLADAISAFQSDLRMYGVEDKVVGMTFSEFGRRAASNGSLGTDHGTSAPMFVFGKHVQPGVVGANPNLSDLSGGNLKMQIDFRRVYSSIMTGWFGIGQTAMNEVMKRDFAYLPLFSTAQSLSMEVVQRHTLTRGQSYTYQMTALDESEAGTEAIITVIDEVASPAQQQVVTAGINGTVTYTVTVPPDKPAGRYAVRFGLPSGYFTVIEVEVP